MKGIILKNSMELTPKAKERLKKNTEKKINYHSVAELPQKENVEITKLCDTFKGDYGKFTECIISIQQGGKSIVLKQDDLEKLLQVMGIKF